MNKTAIKNFAIRARVQLIEAVKQRAFEYDITENGENRTGIDAIGGKPLTIEEKKQRQQLIEEINRKSYTQVMEEAAYTWFNRFIALRFMEVNGFLPSKVRVFTDENGAFKPELLKDAMTVDIDGLDRSKIMDLLDRQDNEELYKYLLIAQCNALNQGLPYMFEKISNWTELLFPINLLRSDSVIAQMVSEIPEEDWLDAVQIIGWLYQYYNSELKDDTFALLKKNVKISKERIPAATQLFTPDWIVRYMVENSLGRLYISDQLSVIGDQSEAERIAAEKEIAEKMGWRYYLPEAEQEPEVRAQLNALTTDRFSLTTTKIIDPCMGSGHILVYAFDVLLQIYTAFGWSERDAAKSIVENNLYGLDIDDRAGQLAYFAVMMKARKHSRRILNGETKPNVFAIQDSGFMRDGFVNYVANNDPHMKADLTLLRSTLKDAKELGSIINMPKLNFQALYERIDIIRRSFAEDIFQIEYQQIAAEQLLPLVKQAEVMAQKYDVVVTNPPYMGSSGMSSNLTDFVKRYYPDSKSDLFATFIEKGNTMIRSNRYNCMVTMQSWMFLSSFENMRKSIINSNIISNLMHMENMVMGIAFGTAVTVFKNTNLRQYKGTYNHVALKDIVDGIPKEFPIKGNRFAQTSTSNFSKIPGSPIAYWLSEVMLNNFNCKNIGSVLTTREGMATADNDRFLRNWFEVSIYSVCFEANHPADIMSPAKWVPYNKGGEFRKWYGNNEFVVNWENDGFEIRNNIDKKTGRIRSHNYNGEYAFKEGITWSALSSGSISVRYCGRGFLFDSKGAKGFSIDKSMLLYCQAVINSVVGFAYLQVLSPTIDFKVGDIILIPLKHNADSDEVGILVQNAVEVSRDDWDSFETSWDFKKHPLV